MVRPIFLMWYDDNPKVPVGNKIEAAIDAYISRFKMTPNLVLVNEAEVVQHHDVQVRGVSHIRRNNFWVGLDDTVKI